MNIIISVFEESTVKFHWKHVMMAVKMISMKLDSVNKKQCYNLLKTTNIGQRYVNSMCSRLNSRNNRHGM